MRRRTPICRHRNLGRTYRRAASAWAARGTQRDQIRRHEYLYYVLDDPEVTDAQFDAQVVTAKKVSADEFKPGSYVGVTSVKGPDGRLVAKRVHALGPQVPQMHGAWDSIPDSMMTI